MKEIPGGVTVPKKYLAGGTCCGIKRGVPDLGILMSESEASVAGVFTTNLVKAASVKVSLQQITKGRGRAVVVNSGNANACTGEEGLNHAWEMVAETARALSIPHRDVLVCSTGIIGKPLPIKLVKNGIRRLANQLSPQGGKAFAHAILTTDRSIKEVAFKVETLNGSFRIGGAAKGAGMIHPQMATMLGFITTDLRIDPALLREILKEAVKHSFNRISVDGDTSTNDTVLAFANGASGVKGEGEALRAFQEALLKVCQRLALMIVHDGEGATKAVKILVKGARTEEDADKAARRLANSPLVKTALYGEDPNWGRLMAALGSSGSMVEPSTVGIWIGETQVVQHGTGIPEAERKAQETMKQKEFTITIDLGLGGCEAWIWTCDLSYDYVRINAASRS